jgi:hypothetical protein
MKLPTLNEFLQAPRPLNSYIREPGFTSLYMRKGSRYLRVRGKLEVFPFVIDIANAEVSTRRRGTGLFTALVQRLAREWPKTPNYFENVLNPRLVKYLPLLGCKKVTRQDTLGAPCFVLWPKEK